jgi:hypothetical protein
MLIGNILKNYNIVLFDCDIVLLHVEFSFARIRVTVCRVVDTLYQNLTLKLMAKFNLKIWTLLPDSDSRADPSYH